MSEYTEINDLIQDAKNKYNMYKTLAEAATTLEQSALEAEKAYFSAAKQMQTAISFIVKNELEYENEQKIPTD